MFGLIASLLIRILELYNIVLLIYVLLSWLNVPANKFVRVINSLVEPALVPVRRMLSNSKVHTLPFDFSPVALWLILSIVQSLLRALFL